MTDLDWVPDGIDVNVPSVARTYDYLLGGAHNLAVDRRMGDQMLCVLPGARDLVRLNRAFLRRAVTHLVDSGINQFLDIGSGIPTVGNVHEIAPQANVVYVDKDPVAVAHSRMILAGVERATAVQADLREPEDLLSRPEITALLDFDRPIAVLMLLVVHFSPDSEDPVGYIGRYRDRLAPGSRLVVSHATADRRVDTMREAANTVRRSNSQDNLVYRTHAEVSALFTGFELEEPGVTGCALWRPDGVGGISDDPDDNTQVYVGVGRKPATGSR
ncbi:SAM-dependent methyltransferase [Saccharothrix tamanrassetensis]|uniref:SAM-dependent methyltransferase n=1 Tax=Saccharothrix tamanrassetensis TaxID=1051531 RepID=A0A841CCA4_9PSEU|nr:SAM-dependent methyltransferase [Saccharothrix tamanrassetensis]MBB5953994.1 SAM-dependent methyltransferase [Saccharothrix tamanrassetensis]